MGQRNMLCTNQMIGFELDHHGQNYLRPEPCILLGPNANFPQPNIRSVVPASGNTANIDVQYLIEHCDNPVIYGMTQYNGMQHHRNLDLGVAPAANFYYSYVTPLSSSVALPTLRSHGASNHLPSSSNYVSSLNTRHPDGVAVMDAASFDLSQYRGVGTPSLMEVGPQRSLRNRSGANGMDSLVVHDHNHLIQGSYMGQPFQSAGALWLDQQLNSNSADGGASAWNQASAMPYIHGSNANGTRSIGISRYHETASSRALPSFQHPLPINHRHHNQHHPSPPMLGARGQNINFHSPVAAASYRVSTNPSTSTLNPAQNSFEMGLRHPGSVQPTGLRIYRPHRGGFVPEATLRHRNLPHLRVLQADELLALGEQIGNVSTGLSEETVRSQLRTKTYVTSATVINLEEAASMDQEADSCIICQDEYKNREKIGILDCGHEYHANCLKKWLLVKNVCPICKSEALTRGRKDV
ncbi:E3 ubiquitin ligase BIG BROTHER [Morella rubra]|uniref:RING-type E3 ubiquitin transferase n=1 Tax=Morella rubra TaxID=262757 RepID=A0A6A1VXF5_9ROSI|nr:E3 ubiquitin ligase BIG BROTHER [Morella rubra]